MNDEAEDKETNEPIVPTFLETDWYLAQIVDLVNGIDNADGFQLTLTVSGQLVSGTLIGGKQYFEEISKQLLGDADGESAEISRAYFSQPAEMYGSNQPDDREDPRYLHMKDARFFYADGNPIPGNRGLLWRCRLSAVDSFAVGKLAAERQ